MRSRWTIPPAAVAIHLCVGSVYAWSVFNKPIEALHPAWPRGAAAYTFSIAIAMLGLSAAFGGTWLERHGPRRAATVAACLFGGGLMLGGLGVWLGSIWLLFLGYGVVGGAGLGLAYVSPVSALIKWFPDRRGLATGMAVLGFGGGALIAAPLKERMIAAYGVSTTLVALGASYLVIMLVAARALDRPPPGWAPAGYTPPAVAAAELTMPMAVRTRQFWLLWGMLFINITAGISILAQASPLMQDMFARTPEQAAQMLAVIAGFNAFGRIFWASLSDWLGRRNVFLLFFAVQALLFAAIPTLGAGGHWGLFQVAAVIIFTMYGGGFATIPAFLADIFGPANVGAIHGALLTSWSAAAIVGPLVITELSNRARAGLAPGADRVHIYDTPLQVLAVLLAVGFVLTLLVRPLESRDAS